MFVNVIVFVYLRFRGIGAELCVVLDFWLRAAGPQRGLDSIGESQGQGFTFGITHEGWFFVRFGGIERTIEPQVSHLHHFVLAITNGLGGLQC